MRTWIKNVLSEWESTPISLRIILSVLTVLLLIVLYFSIFTTPKWKNTEGLYDETYEPVAVHRFNWGGHTYCVMHVDGSNYIVHDPECEIRDFMEAQGYIEETDIDGNVMWVDPD